MKKLLSMSIALALVLSFSLAATTPVAASPADWYVDASADPGGDGSQGDPYQTIGEAITAADPGDTIEVAEGTYVEQLTIGNSLTILGIDSPTIEAPEPAARTTRTISGGADRELDWVVLFEDVEEFTFDGFVVDGKEDGTSVRFVGILVGNSAGTISGNEVINVRGGTEGGTGGIIVYGEDSVVDIVGNEVRDFRKGGIVAVSDATVSIVGNTVVGDGPIDTIAQNGIQIGFGATGEIIGNDVSDIFYDDEGWASCGILVIQSDDVLVEDNEVYDCQSGIYISPPVDNSIVRGNNVVDCESAIVVPGWLGVVTGERLIEDNQLFDNYRGISIYDTAGWLITGNIVDGSTTRGIAILGACSDNTVEANTLTNNAVGVLVGNDGYGDPENTVVRFNNIAGNTDFGVEVLEYGDPEVVDATNNWWGDASGPSGEGLGTGDAVSDNVDFMPWLIEEDGAETTETDTGTGVDAEASTTDVSATATGGSASTTVTVGEYVGNPTVVDPGFEAGAIFFDVHVGGTHPSQLVVDFNCPGDDCSEMVLRWFDGTAWQEVDPQEDINGIIQATLDDASSPTIEELTGTPFGLGNPEPEPEPDPVVVGWEGSPVNKAAVMAPWLALLAGLMAGATLLVMRRRRAEI